MRTRKANRLTVWAALPVMFILGSCTSSSSLPTPTLFALPTWPPASATPSPVVSVLAQIATPESTTMIAEAATPTQGTPSVPGDITPTDTGVITPTDAGVMPTQQEATPAPTEVTATESQPSSTVPFACVADAVFVADVTIPDYTVILPDTSFVKTWRVQNTGTCDWGTGYMLVSDSPLGAASPVPIPQTPAGGVTDISVNMVAPAAAGTYTSGWSMQAPDGTTFGNYLWALVVIPGTPTATPRPTMPTYPTPSTISGITSTSRQIFLKGQSKGNRRDVFAKVGDSLTDEAGFLRQIGDGMEVLHNYSYLQPAINYFRVTYARNGNSFNNWSLAGHGGWDSFDLLDPASADLMCGGVSPIQCEYNFIKPSVAIIMIGTNEPQESLNSGTYEANLRKVVQTYIDLGVIPVLSTIPWNPFRDPRPFNATITRIARSYDIPLMDYWQLMEALPNHGLRDDQVHPSYPPDGNAADLSDENLKKYGYPVRNLLTLQMLDALWRQVLSY